MDVMVGHRVLVTDDGVAQQVACYMLLMSREDLADLAEVGFVGLSGMDDCPPISIAVNLDDPDHDGWVQRMIRLTEQTLNGMGEGA